MKTEDLVAKFDVTPSSWRSSGFRLLSDQIDPHGVVGWGQSLTLERLVLAYSLGIFPWPHDGELFWFCPPQRGVLEFQHLNINKRFLRKYHNTDRAKGGSYTYTLNKDFKTVIRKCATQPRKGQAGTWITDYMIEAYERLERAGHILSFECWRGQDLVGGLYGVLSKDKKQIISFSAESVFGAESDVAKFCLMTAIQYLQEQGLQWMDIQMVTPLTKSFGGHLESRDVFLRRIGVIL